MPSVFALDWYFIILIFLSGFYCLLVSRELLRQLIGFELMSKSCLFGVASAGWLTGGGALAQAVLITMIIADASVAAAGLAVLIKRDRLSRSADPGGFGRLKG